MPLNSAERNNIRAGWKVRVGARDLTITKVVRGANGSLVSLEAGGMPLAVSAINRVVSK